ncbi:hypothetical protein S58_71710 [Bradyrhizobium oligotrophicum S58]|uniref:Uncharacterized protein n=1 Tax=Bradyrhizobium oligotrophicum S58 TaxID=1245469 RepID=M5A2M5_9BRAD|nr:hypothetical protein [Bradyrhizobium oligotrophicum]BAM93135.1 hypothetical protein S58_71710 [Bradyrhizobium oligotrophicum S58]
MSIVSIMAAFLEEELREHGIRGLTKREHETIVISMIKRTAELETDVKQRRSGARLDDQN